MPKNFFFEMTYDKFKKIADYRKAAVATLNYIATRENQQGEEMSRTLFGKERTYQLEDARAFVNAIQMKQSDTPRRAGGLMCRAASKAADMTPDIFACAGPSVSPTLEANANLAAVARFVCAE
jgi:hypothetical protein